MSNDGLQQLFEESVSHVTATNSVQLGSERWHNGDKYQYIYNKSSTQACPGAAMVYIGANASASSGYSLTVSSTAGDYDIGGVVKNATIAAGYYGWVVVNGVISGCQTSSGTTAGHYVALGGDGLFRSGSATTGDLYQPVGVALTATAASAYGTFTVRVNCA
jgi:hypothetical protein